MRMRERFKQLSVAMLVCSAALLGCGEDETSVGSSAPDIDMEGLLKECAMSDSGDDRFEGEFVSRLAVPVTDANSDLEKVTVTIGGATFEMQWAVKNEDGTPGDILEGTVAELNVLAKSGAGTIHLFERGEDSAPIRCEAGTSLVFRATDVDGNITVEENSLP